MWCQCVGLHKMFEIISDFLVAFSPFQCCTHNYLFTLNRMTFFLFAIFFKAKKGICHFNNKILLMAFKLAGSIFFFFELSYVLYFNLNPSLSTSDLRANETRLCTITKATSPRLMYYVRPQANVSATASESVVLRSYLPLTS